MKSGDELICVHEEMDEGRVCESGLGLGSVDVSFFLCYNPALRCLSFPNLPPVGNEGG